MARDRLSLREPNAGIENTSVTSGTSTSDSGNSGLRVSSSESSDIQSDTDNVITYRLDNVITYRLPPADMVWGKKSMV